MSIAHLHFSSLVLFYLQLDTLMYDRCYCVNVGYFERLLVLMLIFGLIDMVEEDMWGVRGCKRLVIS